MPITYNTTNSGSIGSGASSVITIPTHSVGDLLIVAIGTDSGTVTTPSGWTLILSGSSGSGTTFVNAYLFGRIATSNSTTLTITHTSDDRVWQAWSIQDHNVSTITNVSSTSDIKFAGTVGTATPANGGTVTGLNASVTYLGIDAFFYSTSAQAPGTLPTGFGDLVNFDSGGGTTGAAEIATATRTWTPGTSASASWPYSGSGRWAGGLFLIPEKPAGPVADPITIAVTTTTSFAPLANLSGSVTTNVVTATTFAPRANLVADSLTTSAVFGTSFSPTTQQSASVTIASVFGTSFAPVGNYTTGASTTNVVTTTSFAPLAGRIGSVTTNAVFTTSFAPTLSPPSVTVNAVFGTSFSPLANKIAGVTTAVTTATTFAPLANRFGSVTIPVVTATSFSPTTQQTASVTIAVTIGTSFSPVTQQYGYVTFGVVTATSFAPTTQQTAAVQWDALFDSSFYVPINSNEQLVIRNFYISVNNLPPEVEIITSTVDNQLAFYQSQGGPFVTPIDNGIWFYQNNSGLTPIESYTLTQHITAYFNKYTQFSTQWRNWLIGNAVTTLSS